MRLVAAALLVIGAGSVAAAQPADPAVRACETLRQISLPQSRSAGERIEGRAVVLAIEGAAELRCAFKLDAATNQWRFDNEPTQAAEFCSVIVDAAAGHARAERIDQLAAREAELRECRGVLNAEASRASLVTIAAAKLQSQGGYPIRRELTALLPAP
jgi:hypothetical protein